MKIKILLLFTIVFSLAASCEADDNETQSLTAECNCTTSYALYNPPMGSGQSQVPGFYDVVDEQVGRENCNEATGGWVENYGPGYTHYKVVCE